MTILLLVVMLASCAALRQDMSGKMFTFPQQTNSAYVKLSTSVQNLSALTVCHRSFTDLKRDHSLFSMSTRTASNAFLTFWDSTNKEMEVHLRERASEYPGLDYKLNMWHSICTTWDSTSGLVQLWFNGQPLTRKFGISGSSTQGPFIIILGQEQDSHGGGFDLKQSFVGMMSDVHMWDYTLSACEIRNYMDDLNYTPGNVLNWRALEYQIFDRVLVDKEEMTCH
ncbi:C-reactive protein-like [Labrus mixtus]|uniref:C-reactive protein-like n=1 Tax=Labrus mixtus TaxID=508554 RepID=UPI0029BFEFA1|nr:C-reactive protein-like [Labrus mixtus]XP_060906512.1 C-reactive protein-like [Labrus mixtus]